MHAQPNHATNVTISKLEAYTRSRRVHCHLCSDTRVHCTPLMSCTSACLVVTGRYTVLWDIEAESTQAIQCQLAVILDFVHAFIGTPLSHMEFDLVG